MMALARLDEGARRGGHCGGTDDIEAATEDNVRQMKTKNACVRLKLPENSTTSFWGRH